MYENLWEYESMKMSVWELRIIIWVYENLDVDRMLIETIRSDINHTDAPF